MMQKLFLIFILLVIGFNSFAQDIIPPRSRVNVIINIDTKYSGKYHITTNYGTAFFEIDGSKETDVKSFDYELIHGDIIEINIYKKKLFGGYKALNIEATKDNKGMPYLVLSLNKKSADKKTLNVLWVNQDVVKEFKDIETFGIRKYVGCINWL